MENTNNRIQCRYCQIYFRPDPKKINMGASKRKSRFYIECPRCGNGFEIAYRRSYKERKW